MAAGSRAWSATGVVALLVIVAHCALLAVPVAAAAAAQDASEVVVLSDSDFDTHVTDDTAWLVEFYAPWCGHCKHLAPIFDEASLRLKGKLNLGKVDATENPQLKSRFSIAGYPSIRYFRGGVVNEYTLGRTVEDFVQFGDRMLGDAVTKLSTSGAVASFVKEHPVTFLFAKPKGGFSNVADQDLYDAFKEAATEVQAYVDCAETRDEEFLASAGITAPALVKYEPGEQVKVFSGDVLADFIAEWMLDNQFETVTQIAVSNFQLLSKRGRKLVIGAVNPEDAAAADAHRAMLKKLARPSSGLAEHVRETFYFCWIDGVKWVDFVKQFNIKQSELPRAFVLDPKDKSFFEDIEVDELTELETFLTHVVDGKAPKQRQGFWGYSDRAMAHFKEWMPHSAILLASIVIVVIYSCWPSTKPKTE